MKENNSIPISDSVLERFAAAAISHPIEFYSNPENQKAYELYTGERPNKNRIFRLLYLHPRVILNTPKESER